MQTGDGRELVIRAVRSNPEFLMVAFVGLDDRSAVEGLADQELTIEVTERRRLTNNEFWSDQLIGLTVVDQSGQSLGKVVDVELGQQDRLVVAGPNGRAEIPFVEALVPKVDLEAGVVLTELPEGIFTPE